MLETPDGWAIESSLRYDIRDGGQLAAAGDLTVGGAEAGELRVDDAGSVAAVTGRLNVTPNGTVRLDGGRLEFGVMSVDDFARLSGPSGQVAGALDPLDGFNDAAPLTAPLSGFDLDVTEVELANNGVLFGSASIDVALQNHGEVETSVGDRLRFGGVGNTNAGEVNNFGGQVRFDGDATNEATGFVGGRGQFVADGGWTNEGTMAFSAGPADILGDFENAAGGVVVTSGGAVTTFFDDLTHNGAEIRTAAGSSTVVFGAASGAGAYTGAGTVFFEGDLRPGDSPASVAFGGAVVLGTSAETEIELSGDATGEFDRLVVAGEATLSGGLAVSLLGGYTPGVGDAFEIVSAAGGVSGAYASESLPDLGPLLDFGVRYRTDSVLLVVAPSLPGDYNADGVVDAADYAVWESQFATESVAADGNGDGLVDAADYTIWRDNLGATAAALAIPEPTTLTLLLAAATFFVRRR